MIEITCCWCSKIAPAEVTQRVAGVLTADVHFLTNAGVPENFQDHLLHQLAAASLPGWRIVEISDAEHGRKVRAFFCADHFPPDDAPVEAFAKAYAEAMARALDRYQSGLRMAANYRNN